MNLLRTNNILIKDLCKEISISTGKMSEYVNNKDNISSKYIHKISTYFNIEPHLIQPQKGDGCVK